jgi:hypothetical protein
MGCGGPAPSPIPTPWPSEITSWDSVHAAALRLAREGDPFTADSLLTAFAGQYAGTPEAGESLYWRALLRLDPDNPAAGPRDALAAVDAYLALGADQPRYDEALVLRRIASTLDSLRQPRVVVSPTPLADADTTAAVRARDEEIKRLREELQRTQAELERIRRRLGNPRPEPRQQP